MNKIDIRDLRVGNWLSVHHPTMPAENIQISADWIRTIERINNGLIKEDSPLFRIVEPIPLTAEILEKNGFEWRAYGVVLAGEDMALVQCGDYWKIKPNQYSNDTFCYIWYVHELQCALRLCGIEKEITI